MFILVNQCMRTTININKGVFLCRSYCSLKRTLRPIPLVKLSHYSVKHRPILSEKIISKSLFRSKPSLNSVVCNVYSTNKKSVEEAEKKKGFIRRLVQKFKDMFWEYWYVLGPVHASSSVLWFVGFYYLAASGINIPGILEKFEVPEVIISYVKNSGAGYVALAISLYKIFAPLRYAVSLGISQLIINYLKKIGWANRVPNLGQVMKYLKSKFNRKMQVTKVELGKKKEKLKGQIEAAKEEINMTMNETRRDFKEGVKGGVEEWKCLSRAINQEIKRGIKKGGND